MIGYVDLPCCCLQTVKVHASVLGMDYPCRVLYHALVCMLEYIWIITCYHRYLGILILFGGHCNRHGHDEARAPFPVVVPLGAASARIKEWGLTLVLSLVLLLTGYSIL